MVAAPFLRPGMDRPPTLRRLRIHNPRIKVLARAIQYHRLPIPPQPKATQLLPKVTQLQAVLGRVPRHLAVRAHVK